MHVLHDTPPAEPEPLPVTWRIRADAAHARGVYDTVREAFGNPGAVISLRPEDAFDYVPYIRPGERYTDALAILGRLQAAAVALSGGAVLGGGMVCLRLTSREWWIVRSNVAVHTLVACGFTLVEGAPLTFRGWDVFVDPPPPAFR